MKQDGKKRPRAVAAPASSAMDDVGGSRSVRRALEIFEFLLKRYGLTAAQTVFIDDNAQNTEAARALGIHTVWFKNAGQCESELEAIFANR